MRNLLLTLVGLLSFTGVLIAQESPSIEQRVADKTCECLSAFRDEATINDSLEICVERGLKQVVAEGGDEVVALKYTVEGIEKLVQYASGTLYGSCEHVRIILVQSKREKFYKVSEVPKAAFHYERGNEMMQAGFYEDAVSHFEDAVKLDKNFVYAMDHLAMSWRQQGEYEKAIKYYKKSLEIFPEGNYALMNMAVSYRKLNKLQEAFDSYAQILHFYPEDPEGFFGMGGILADVGRFEEALDFLISAHIIYRDTNNEYITDTQAILSNIYKKMEEQGKLEVFNQKMKEKNVVFTPTI
jgi:tetratricopeptide (TPR) repeat protein